MLELIFRHPVFLDGPAMVKPPVVANAGCCAAIGRSVDTDDWAYLSGETGQTLFYPPNVSGWDDDRWIDTNTWRGRWHVTGVALAPSQVPTERAVDLQRRRGRRDGGGRARSPRSASRR